MTKLRGFSAIASTCAVVSLFATSAFAHSAIALGQPANVAQAGVAVGFSYNYSTRAEAETEAMDQCHSTANAPDATKAMCHLVGSFDDECFSDSLDPQPGTYGFGWAVASTREVANSQALEACQASAIDGRASYCVVSATQCDGEAAKSP